MEAILSRSFKKQFRKLPLKQQTAFLDRLDIFLANPHDLMLGNHALRGEWSGLRSINVSGDCRAVYESLSKHLVKFHAIGSHSQLYG